jgi:hypothetical protein
MTQTQDHWAEAADRIAALALKLKLHTEEELSEAGVSLQDIAEKVGGAVSSAAEALADACHDQAIRQDLRDAGAAISDAVRASLHAAKRSID